MKKILATTIYSIVLSTTVHAGSSDDFRNALLGSDTSINTGKQTVKYRGISLKKNTPTGKSNTTIAKKMVSACLAEKPSVAINVVFDSGSTQVQDPELMKNIASAMNSPKLEDCFFVIEGHTDASGNDYRNLWLSQERAEQVKNSLTQHNVATSRLIVVGKGEKELLNKNKPSAAENRRVVFKVVNYKH